MNESVETNTNAASIYLKYRNEVSCTLTFEVEDWLSGLDYATLYKDTGALPEVGFEIFFDYMVNEKINDYMCYDYFLLHGYDNASNKVREHC